MKKWLSILFVVVVVSFDAFSQGPIEDYPLFLRLTKAKREVIVENFRNQNYEDIFVSESVQGRTVLSNGERLLLHLIKGDFRGFIRESQEGYVYHVYDKWGNDFLLELRENVSSRKSELITQAKSGNYRDDELAFIEFFLDDVEYLVLYPDIVEKRLEMHRKARSFMSRFPFSDHYRLVRGLHGTFEEFSWFAMDFNFGLGFGRNYDELVNHATRTWGLDMDIKTYLHSSFLGLRGNSNFNVVRRQFNIDSTDMLVDDGYFMSYYDVYLGRKFDFAKRFSIAPFVGSGVSEIYYASNSGQEQRRFAMNLNYGFDFNYNFKPQLREYNYFARYKRRMSDYAAYFRLNMSMHHPGLARHSMSMDGRALSVNLGFGVHFRAYRKRVVFEE